MLSHEIAKRLYEIEAVQIKTDRSFTWTSGIKSPIYCDNRLTLSYPDVREVIVDAFVEIIGKMDDKPDIIAGCATAGIPHAAWLAQRLNLPMVYVRSKPKAHGKGNQIEGKISAGQKVVVIEDLISTGGSALNSALALQAEGVEVLGTLAIFTYGLSKSFESFSEQGIELKTITSFDVLLDYLVSIDNLTVSEKEGLMEWRDSLFERIKSN
ncbi:orotate phosphoribosyltransferase [Aquibacillus rhizosphaerae]|uniref:Orotate phosphoribosyltransferase n=1 Tax=Aquibacillus rhizosphaerae TaxID=3051431 RepID=A0ABT7L2E5_9BACI|nr:orotate phosphoribosyltransferase [Aquibacillus sp. LR5S19]MDL4840002.1 orotate phosphoribosyltransferase [Aquibacillus sp. LR5S19]